MIKKIWLIVFAVLFFAVPVSAHNYVSGDLEVTRNAEIGIDLGVGRDLYIGNQITVVAETFGDTDIINWDLAFLHISTDGTSHSDVVLNNTHRGLTNNPHSVTAAQAGAVALTGDESVDGVKTFSSFPITPSAAPTTDYQVSNKKYVDDLGATFVLIDGTRLLTGDWDAGAFDIKAQSFSIGANTLNASEWGYLDGLDQALNTDSYVYHDQIGGTTKWGCLNPQSNNMTWEVEYFTGGFGNAFQFPRFVATGFNFTATVGAIADGLYIHPNPGTDATLFMSNNDLSIIISLELNEITGQLEYRVINTFLNPIFPGTIWKDYFTVTKNFTAEKGQIYNSEIITSNRIVTDEDFTLLLDASANSIIATLPASPIHGQLYHIKCIDNTFACTIDRNGNLIDGQEWDFVFTVTEAITIQYNSTYGWAIL